MYENLKHLIESGTRTLRDLERRIAWHVAKGTITPEQADELTALAAEQSAPPDVPESTEMAVSIGELRAAVASILGRLTALEGNDDAGHGDGGETPVEPPDDGIPAWVAGTAYMYGDVVRHDGKIWTSQEGNNRFTPGVEAWAWKAAS